MPWIYDNIKFAFLYGGGTSHYHIIQGFQALEYFCSVDAGWSRDMTETGNRAIKTSGTQGNHDDISVVRTFVWVVTAARLRKRFPRTKPFFPFSFKILVCCGLVSFKSHNRNSTQNNSCSNASRDTHTRLQVERKKIRRKKWPRASQWPPEFFLAIFVSVSLDGQSERGTIDRFHCHAIKK